MTDSTQAWHAVHPHGLAAAILVVTIVFTVLTLIVFGLRVWIRITTRCFGPEDWLMTVGTVGGEEQNMARRSHLRCGRS